MNIFEIVHKQVTFTENISLSRKYNVSASYFVRETIECGKSIPANRERRKEETKDIGRQSRVRLFRVNSPENFIPLDWFGKYWGGKRNKQWNSTIEFGRKVQVHRPCGHSFQAKKPKLG